MKTSKAEDKTDDDVAGLSRWRGAKGEWSVDRVVLRSALWETVLKM